MGGLAHAFPIGRRLGQFREAINPKLNQRGMAEIADVSEGGWSTFETGNRRITLNVAIGLCKQYDGLTLDWIYLGRTDGLSPRLRKLLA